MTQDILTNPLFQAAHLVGFPVVRANLSEIVWLSDSSLLDGARLTETDFASRFSYVVAESDTFKHLKINAGETLTAYAERYGGRGVGNNGGGARCGNIGHYQVKGIGRNPLAGGSPTEWHSYGGLNARDAIYEAVYSEVLGKILPLGVVKTHGVILTSPLAAYNEFDPKTANKAELGWGALMVRDICLRPGHFFRAAHHAPHNKGPDGLSSDIIRVRDVHQILSKIMSTTALVSFLGTFLRNCANQFSFAKIARISHGGICPSNLSFDGRWIDLTNATFVDGARNIGGLPPFHEEAWTVIEILKEFVATHCKYNNISLNINPLLEYYASALNSYFIYYSCDLFGINRSDIPPDHELSVPRELARQMHVIIEGSKAVINAWPTHVDELDKILLLQEGLFLSLVCRDEGLSRLRQIALRELDPMITVGLFEEFLHDTFRKQKHVIPEFNSFMLACAIRALKKTLYVEYFYKGSLGTRIASMLDTSQPDIKKFIQQSAAVAEWVYEPRNSPDITLFDNEALRISFNPTEGVFQTAEIKHNRQYRHGKAADVIGFLLKIPKDDYLIAGYSFESHLFKILKLLHTLNCRKECHD